MLGARSIFIRWADQDMSNPVLTSMAQVSKDIQPQAESDLHNFATNNLR
jgi:hypothetical protein